MVGIDRSDFFDSREIFYRLGKLFCDGWCDAVSVVGVGAAGGFGTYLGGNMLDEDYGYGFVGLEGCVGGQYDGDVCWQFGDDDCHVHLFRKEWMLHEPR